MLEPNDRTTHGCPLCGILASLGCQDAATDKKYLRCPQCDLYFLRPTDRLSAEKEKAHYDHHNNDVADPRYQSFVLPLHQHIRRLFAPGTLGLDFGAGPGPVLAEMLRRDGYRVDVYDPLYWPDQAPLHRRYDFVIACEVVEHFYNPAREFELLFSLVKPGGVLALMTLMRDEETQFSDWHYRIDPTHVVFYSPKTFGWIKKNLGFIGLEIDGKRVVLLKR